MIKKIKSVKKGKTSYRNVLYIGEEPTYKEVYSFCVKTIKEIENSKDYVLLSELYKKIKVKYENKIKKLELLKDIKSDLEFNHKSTSDDIWGE